MSALADFQIEFAAALLSAQTMPCECYGVGPCHVGMAVYRNTVMKGLVDALRANYPTLERLVGAEWFDSVALLYARDHLPEEPTLAMYGDALPAFLKHFATAGEFPYLPFVAQLDRLWTETHFAIDAPCLRAAQLTSLSPQALNDVQLQLHPAARFAQCQHSAATIWLSHRPPALPPESFEIDDSDEAVLITRPQGAVEVLVLTPECQVFLSQLQAGQTLGAAAAQLLELDARADVAGMLAKLINVGAFAEITGAHLNMNGT